MELLVRNRVQDFDRWRRVFDAQAEAQPSAGMRLLRMWRSADDDNDVFFLMHVEDRATVEAYMGTPESAAAGVEAGVVDGEVWFIDEVDP